MRRGHCSSSKRLRYSSPVAAGRDFSERIQASRMHRFFLKSKCPMRIFVPVLQSSFAVEFCSRVLQSSFAVEFCSRVLQSSFERLSSRLLTSRVLFLRSGGLAVKEVRHSKLPRSVPEAPLMGQEKLSESNGCNLSHIESKSIVGVIDAVASDFSSVGSSIRGICFFPCCSQCAEDALMVFVALTTSGVCAQAAP